MTADVTSLRDLLEFLEKEGGLLTSKKEIDPVCEVSGVAKAFEGGPASLFEKIKGFPNHRIAANLMGNQSILSKIFNVDEYKNFKFKCLDALKNPISPKIIGNASCQETVITSNVDILKTMPVTQSIETDPGRIITSGISLISGKGIGHCLAFRRTFFRGKDWASMAIAPGGHLHSLLSESIQKKRKIPLTLNIGCPPSVFLVAAGGQNHSVIHQGTDELAIAGGLQGTPVEICHAKTVDAFSIAKAEWVIEGYLEPYNMVWEDDEAERTGDEFRPFLIEWLGYQGWAKKQYKFKATAITHQKDRPIYQSTLASCSECFSAMKSFGEAVNYSVCNDSYPNLVQDINVLDSMHGYGGLVVQVKKRQKDDDTHIKSIIEVLSKSSPLHFMLIIVDIDINIYSAEDVLWAMMTRVRADTDIISFGVSPYRNISKVGFDATIPFDNKFSYQRNKHPKVDLKKWFSNDQIKKANKMQNEYSRFIAEMRY